MKLDIASAAMLKTFLYAGITLLVAVLTDYVLRSLIRVPKHFNNKRTRTVAAVTRNIITTFVYVCAGYIIITIFGIDLTPLLASASVVGIIIGIGARSIIEDFVNGLFLLSLDSIGIGDYIRTDLTEGIVEQLGARTLTIRANDGTAHIIPNSQVKELVNYSRYKHNLFIDLPVKANQDISKVLKAAETALKELQSDKDFADALFPGSQVNGIEDFKNMETMTVRITLTTYPIRRWEIGRKYRFLVKKAFEKEKILFA
ncbi:MAG TPA: mechanosensitive ion channel domain-containing protein [Candidatus Saccharimonadales bacterium]|nr:mechanosensitive ion channel domain-containing protein [Candidatus Saccharimonadales bacterium]